jgi:hypothetical protein
MFSDLKVTIVEGGPDPESWKGMYPPYLYFSSREGKFRSGNWKIKNGVSKGRVVFKKEVLFYFEYEEGEKCRVYKVKEGFKGEDFIDLEYEIALID